MSATEGELRDNFETRMYHIRDHIVNDGFRPHDRDPDGWLISHLKKQGLLSQQAHDEWVKPQRLPPVLSGGRSGSRHSNHGGSNHHHRSQHLHLPAVDEEARPPSSRDRKYAKNSDEKEHKRDSHSRRKPAK